MEFIHNINNILVESFIMVWLLLLRLVLVGVVVYLIKDIVKLVLGEKTDDDPLSLLDRMGTQEATSRIKQPFENQHHHQGARDFGGDFQDIS